MKQTPRFTSVALLAITLLLASGAPRPAQAGVTETALALAAPLAEQFGVPVSSVTGLLQAGVLLESVTQLLLVSKSSGAAFKSVTDLFHESKNNVAATAQKLNVDPKDYSKEQVNAAIDRAKSQAQADATDKATDKAADAVGSALKGWKR